MSRPATNHSPASNPTPRMASRPDWLTEDQWPWPIQALTVGHHTVAYTDVGTGPTLLLVHTGMWSFVWRDLLTVLAPEFRCVVMDAPGTGLTTGPSNVDLDQAAEAITAIVEHLDLVDLTLVLHDLGGPAALQAAAGWPDRVSQLVAVNTFGWRPSGMAFRAMLAVMGSAATRWLDVWTGWLPRLTATRFGVGRNLDTRARRVFRRGMDRRGRGSFHRYMKAVRHHDFSAVETAVAALSDRPLLTIFGQYNDPLGFQPAWAARFPRTTRIEIPKGNHFPMCDAPELVADGIRNWHPRTAPTETRRG